MRQELGTQCLGLQVALLPGGGGCSQHSSLWSCFLIRSQPAEGTKGGQGGRLLPAHPPFSPRTQPHVWSLRLKEPSAALGLCPSLSQQVCLSLHHPQEGAGPSPHPAPGQSSLRPLGHAPAPRAALLANPSSPYTQQAAESPELSETSEAGSKAGSPGTWTYT